jgi:hypothetical protein
MRFYAFNAFALIEATQAFKSLNSRNDHHINVHTFNACER